MYRFIERITWVFSCLLGIVLEWYHLVYPITFGYLRAGEDANLPSLDSKYSRQTLAFTDEKTEAFRSGMPKVTQVFCRNTWSWAQVFQYPGSSSIANIWDKNGIQLCLPIFSSSLCFASFSRPKRAGCLVTVYKNYGKSWLSVRVKLQSNLLSDLKGLHGQLVRRIPGPSLLQEILPNFKTGYFKSCRMIIAVVDLRK